MVQVQQHDILDTILAKRQELIEKRGYSFGHSIPEQRTKPVVPFLPEKGVILEVKRASPSKGDIAPYLNASETALLYGKGGAAAVSVLTEENFFKGNLDDLCTVSNELYAKYPQTAVLRKDFLTDIEEIEISYLCGADVVLLIARILSKESLCAMAQRALSLGMSILCEIREEEDLDKYKTMCLNIHEKNKVFLGINTRDLASFILDPLTPSSFFFDMEKTFGLVYESGVKTPEAASFAGNMGFHGLLMGEAAAKNPENVYAFVDHFKHSQPDMNSRMWTLYASALRNRKKENKYSPYVKICGLTDINDVRDCIELGADMLGFIFSKNSKRCVNRDFLLEVNELVREKKRKTEQNTEKYVKPLLIGVITNPESFEAQEAFTLVREGVLDKIQFHNCVIPPPADKDWKDIPRYAAVKIGKDEDVETLFSLLDKGQPRALIDAGSEDGNGGTGQRIEEAFITRIQGKTPLWLAGGIKPSNVGYIIQKFMPELIDIASGVEMDINSTTEDESKSELKAGKKDKLKLIELFKNIEDACEKVSKASYSEKKEGKDE